MTGQIKKLLIYFFLILWPNFFLTATSAKADQPTHTLEPIVITPTKSLLGLLQDLRQVKIITREKIDELPVHSVAELLHYTLGVDIRQRGSWGIQADVNMRGANFEQVLICLNGLPINDPQTGHHNLDLPVRLADIERIEILPGGGSRLYGAGAFAGTINIITKSPAGSQIEVETSGGSFGLNAQGLSANFPLGNFQNRFSFAREESSGWRSETDFTAKNLSLNTQSSFSWGELGYLFGWTKKDFGADSFYSNFYTQEQEHTDTRFFNLKTLIKNQILALQSDLYFRRHTDHFLLDRTRPGWQENYHTSYSSGLDLDALKTFDFGSLLAGLELKQDKITSTNLGNHSRQNQALSIQLESVPEKRLIYSLGLRLDHYEKWGWQGSPGLSAGYKINPQLKLKSSFGRSFRIPSFTELYYQSVANIGNQDLTPEESWSYEAGLALNQQGLQADLTYFVRWADDLIGWARNSSSDPWQAQNIAQVDTQGWEIEFSLRPKDDQPAIFSELFAGYSYQYSDGQGFNLNTKYALDFLKHHARSGVTLALPGEFTQSLILSYQERIDQRPYFLLDTRISKKIEQDNFDLELFLDVTNLLNTSYSEQTGVAMPGRWISAGMRIRQ